MKIKSLILTLLIFPLLSCSQNPKMVSDRIFCFDTTIDVRLYEKGNEEDLKEIKNIFGKYANLSDNYYLHGNNDYHINETYEELEIEKE